MLMRFLQRLGVQLLDGAVQALQLPYLRAKALLDVPLPNRDEVERDAFLKEKFDHMNEHFLGRLNVIRPDMDNSDKIKVIAVMHTPSLQTCLEGRNENDAVAVFCVVNWTRWDKEAWMSEQNTESMLNNQMRVFFTFADITNSEYYKRIIVLLMSNILPYDAIRLIADEISNDYTTYFMAIWTAPDTRRDWIQFGLNTTRDNDLHMIPVMQSFFDARNKVIEEKLESRGSQ